MGLKGQSFTFFEPIKVIVRSMSRHSIQDNYWLKSVRPWPHIVNFLDWAHPRGSWRMAVLHAGSQASGGWHPCVGDEIGYGVAPASCGCLIKTRSHVSPLKRERVTGGTDEMSRALGVEGMGNAAMETAECRGNKGRGTRPRPPAANCLRRAVC